MRGFAPRREGADEDAPTDPGDSPRHPARRAGRAVGGCGRGASRRSRRDAAASSDMRLLRARLSSRSDNAVHVGAVICLFLGGVIRKSSAPRAITPGDMIPATRLAPTPTRARSRARRSERVARRRLSALRCGSVDRAADDGDKLDRPRIVGTLVRGFTSALILPRSRAALADDPSADTTPRTLPSCRSGRARPRGARATSTHRPRWDSRVPRRRADPGDQKAEGAGLTPVLCLHGGPGLGFKYMDGLEVLASEKREVASYDQIGCARSPYKIAKPKPNGTYTPALFADELAEVRRATGLGRVHVVAHGWGGMLALDHVLGGNGVDGAAAGSSSGGGGVASVASLTLVSVPPSYARLIADRREASADARRVRAGAPRRRRGRRGGR